MRHPSYWIWGTNCRSNDFLNSFAEITISLRKLLSQNLELHPSHRKTHNIHVYKWINLLNDFGNMNFIKSLHVFPWKKREGIRTWKFRGVLIWVAYRILVHNASQIQRETFTDCFHKVLSQNDCLDLLIT